MLYWKELDPEEEREHQKELEEEYKPLVEYLKKQIGETVRDGTLKRLFCVVKTFKRHI